jgi:glutamate-1-semialdehyde 2,1-aminomutase
MNFSHSKEIFEKYSKITPGGVQSNFRFEEPHPIYFKKAKGAKLWDVDGNLFTDYIVGYGSIILGHADPTVTKKIFEYLEYGLSSGVESELNYKVAERLKKMIPAADMVRFSNSGTEAVMHALMLARAYTGKRRIVKVEGAYHGWYDAVAVSYHPSLEIAGPDEAPLAVPNSDGLDNTMAMSTLVVPYNDLETLEKTIKKYRDEVAALIIEPVCFNMGAVLPKKGYLQEVRELTESLEILLIFDEVITGFRLAPGGAQEYFGVLADISIYGKALGNGFPISAVVAREDLMRLCAPGSRVSYAGTYNGNQISMAAAEATLEILEKGEVQKYLHSLTQTLLSSINKIAQDKNIELIAQGLGGQFQLYFTKERLLNYRNTMKINKESYKKLRRDLLEKGILFHQDPLFHHGITKAHSMEDIKILIDTIDMLLEFT